MQVQSLARMRHPLPHPYPLTFSSLLPPPLYLSLIYSLTLSISHITWYWAMKALGSYPTAPIMCGEKEGAIGGGNPLREEDAVVLNVAKEMAASA